MQTPTAAAIVLAAGGGTRMKSGKSKLLHEVAGRPMLSYAVDAAAGLDPSHLVVVVGHLREQVEEHLAAHYPDVTTVEQPVRNGTGGAVQCAMAGLDDIEGDVVVTYADVPMLNSHTLTELIQAHRADGNAVTVLTADVEDPTGYGRIVREGGEVARIVEHKDATEAERAITEINSGIYVFDAEILRAGLASLDDDNAQGELYLTDVLSFARDKGERVGAFTTDDVWQTEGVNDRVQLAAMHAEMNRRICESWMRDGVTIMDPATTWIDADATIENDVTIWPGTYLLGSTSVASGAVVGPDTVLRNVTVGADASVVQSNAEDAVIGAGADVGPYSRIRKGTVLGAGGKIGSFVETKNAKIGDGSKVPHLTYCGDAILGEGVNVGAGTIFANYDGEHKSTTHLGNQVFIGSNSVLVAPVDVADGAFVAAGSAIIEDVEAGALSVARARQLQSSGWVTKRRPGSKADQAARESSGAIHEKVASDRAVIKEDK